MQLPTSATVAVPRHEIQAGDYIEMRLDRDAIHTLATRASSPTVSMYVPIHHPGAEQCQDFIRLKNLINQARPLQDSQLKAELSIPDDMTAIAPIIVGLPRGETPPTHRKEPQIIAWK